MKSPYLNVESLIVNVSWLKSGLPKIAAINGVIRSVMKAFTRAVNARAMTSATATSSRLPFWIQALKSPHQLIPAPPDVERCPGESLRRGGRQGGPVAVALRDLLAEGGEAVGEAAVLDDEQVLRVLEAPAREVVAADERHVVGDHHLRVHVVVHGPGPVGGRALAGEARGDALPCHARIFKRWAGTPRHWPRTSSICVRSKAPARSKPCRPAGSATVPSTGPEVMTGERIRRRRRASPARAATTWASESPRGEK